MFVYKVYYLQHEYTITWEERPQKSKPGTCKGHFSAAKPQSGEHGEGFLVIFILEIKELIYVMNRVTPRDLIST